MRIYNFLLILGLLSGIGFIVIDNLFENSIFHILLKPIPIFCITYYCFINKKFILSSGLLFGALGDILLTQNKEIFFIFGLVSFLIGHILYSVYFFMNSSFNKQGLFLSVITFALSIALSLYIVPAVEEKLKLPVIFYIVGISIMVISTTFYKKFNYFSFLGAVLFLISDSLIAINKFITPIPFAHLWIMILYYLGQWGIGYGGCKQEIK